MNNPNDLISLDMTIESARITCDDMEQNDHDRAVE